MRRVPDSDRNDSKLGFSVLEVAVSAVLLFVVAGVFTSVIRGAQKVTQDSALVSEARRRAQNGLERLVVLTSGAVTNDAEFSLFAERSDGTSSGVRFRTLESVDVVNESQTYSSNRIYIYGPDDTVSSNRGLVIGRGTSLSEVTTTSAGADGLLGTEDDLTDIMTKEYQEVLVEGGAEGETEIVEVTTTQPTLEVLIPRRYKPTIGGIFSVTVDENSEGRFLRYEVRVNVPGEDGTRLLESDLILTQRVALRR